jgi:hypothetical protein
MTKDQIERYEYCKKHLECIKSWKEKLPFKGQHYGQGSGVPNIEHQLANVHKCMDREVSAAMRKAEESIEEIVAKL